MEHLLSQNNTITDEELCKKVSFGDRFAEELLVMRYNRLVRVCSRPFFLTGGDSEDLIQEGMLGLLSAVRLYRSMPLHRQSCRGVGEAAFLYCHPSNSGWRVSQVRQRFRHSHNRWLCMKAEAPPVWRPCPIS